MTVTLTPQTETLLLEKAQREGSDASIIADTLLAAVLQWEAKERTKELEGIQCGLDASDVGRARPFAEFAAEMRRRHSLPVPLSNAELRAEW